MEIDLKDKVIIVAGGAGGIGSVVCNLLRKEKTRVIVADLKTGIDLGNPEKVKDFFTSLRGKYEKLDGFCSLVYGGGGESGIMEAASAEIKQEINSTLLAAVYPIQEAIKWMKKTGGGHIVVVSSVNSILGLNEFAYDLAKRALNGIAPDIATSCGKYGIYAVTLCLGTVGGTPSWRGKENALKKIAGAIPDKHITDANEVANAIVFLLSKHARIFNGCTLIADRGWHLKPVFKK